MAPSRGSFSCIVDLLSSHAEDSAPLKADRFPRLSPGPASLILIPCTFLGWSLPYLEGTAAGAHFRVVAWVMHECGYLLHVHSKSVAPEPGFLKHTLMKCRASFY
jgi:hypothetical protein